MTKVLYIMGLGRSGSTILDLTLGNHDSIVSVGELRNLPYLGWQKNVECSCGRTARECGFWGEVLSQWTRQVGTDRVKELISLQDHYERLRNYPAILANRIFPQPEFKTYGHLISELFHAIQSVSGCQYVVDSTKYPVRGLALSQLADIDLKIVHLVRDGRAVIWSCKRKANTDIDGGELSIPDQKIAGRTTMEWLKANAVSELVKFTSRAPAIRVRYEDFVSENEKTLSTIGDFCGLDLSTVANTIAMGGEISPGHGIAGNRVRWQGAIRLKADMEWQQSWEMTKNVHSGVKRAG